MLVQNQNVSKLQRSHDSASRHVLGSARYTDDLPTPESPAIASKIGFDLTL